MGAATRRCGNNNNINYNDDDDGDDDDDNGGEWAWEEALEMWRFGRTLVSDGWRPSWRSLRAF